MTGRLVFVPEGVSAFFDRDYHEWLLSEEDLLQPTKADIAALVTPEIRRDAQKAFDQAGILRQGYPMEEAIKAALHELLGVKG